MNGNNIELEKLPKKEKVETCCKSILHDDTKFNKNLEWLSDLEKSYRTNVTSTDYNISQSTLDNATNKLQINKATGEDKIAGFW